MALSSNDHEWLVSSGLHWVRERGSYRLQTGSEGAMWLHQSIWFAQSIEMTNTSIDSALLEYLRMSAKRPAMYFGSQSVEHVRRHLDGWRAHRRIHRDEDVFADAFFENFHSFVEDYYQDNRTIGWNGLIRDNTNTEEEGFKMFMLLLEQFAKSFASAEN